MTQSTSSMLASTCPLVSSPACPRSSRSSSRSLVLLTRSRRGTPRRSWSSSNSTKRPTRKGDQIWDKLDKLPAQPPLLYRLPTPLVSSQAPRPLELPGESPPPVGGGPDCKPSIDANGAPITDPLHLQPYQPAPTHPAPSCLPLIVRILATPRPRLPLQLTSLYVQRHNANETLLSPISSAPASRGTIDAPLTPLPLRRVQVHHQPPAPRLLFLLAGEPAPTNAPLLMVLLPLERRITPRRREKKRDTGNGEDIYKRLEAICTDTGPTRLYRNLQKWRRVYHIPSWHQPLRRHQADGSRQAAKEGLDH